MDQFAPPSFNRRLLGFVLMVLVAAGAGLVLLRQSSDLSVALAAPNDEAKTKKTLFEGWPKPDLVLVVTGQMHGYVQPCGCSEPQYGGLARRARFLQSLRDKGWNVLPIDLGELRAPPGPLAPLNEQTTLKYVYSMKALQLMGYGAVGLGQDEFNGPLTDVLGSVVNDSVPPVVATTLKDPNKLFAQLKVKRFVVLDQFSPKVGILSGVDPKSIEPLIKDPMSTFASPTDELPGVLKEMRAAKSALNVLLYQGYEGDAWSTIESIRKKDPTLPPIHLVLCLCDQSDPPSRPMGAGGTHIVTVGHKGRMVGVVGLFKKGTSYELRYELVQIGPEYATPAGQEATNPVLALMESYAKDVKSRNLLQKFPRASHPTQVEMNKKGIQAKFIGSDRCADCHPAADAVFTRGHTDTHLSHHRAFKSLEDAANPSLRHFDGECVKCHTVGFDYHGGYGDKGNKAGFDKKLLNVGCESCHGPGSMHADQPENKEFYPLINPFRATEQEKTGAPEVREALFKNRMARLDGFCQKCHDLENDVHWGDVPFLEKWMRVAHPTPRTK